MCISTYCSVPLSTYIVHVHVRVHVVTKKPRFPQEEKKLPCRLHLFPPRIVHYRGVTGGSFSPLSDDYYETGDFAMMNVFLSKIFVRSIAHFQISSNHKNRELKFRFHRNRWKMTSPTDLSEHCVKPTFFYNFLHSNAHAQ